MVRTDAESYLLRQKYVDIILGISRATGLSLNESFHKFYRSRVYKRMNEDDIEEVLDRDDGLFVQELKEELK